MRHFELFWTVEEKWSKHLHYTENSKHIFPEMKQRSLAPNYYIRITVSDLNIPTIGLPILLPEILGGPIVEIYKSSTDTWMWKLGQRPRSFFSENT